MKTIRTILVKPAFASGVILATMCATAELHAQAAPEAKPAAPGEAEIKPVAEAAGAPETTPTTPTDETMVNDIKKHAELCSEAQLKMDFEGLLPYVPKKLLEIMGGREVLKTKLAEGNAMLKSRGVTIDGASIGRPEAPQKYAGVLASLVPMTTNMTTPQGKVVATSHMIAISEDNGKSWAFVDTATVNEEKLAMLYPALKGKIKIPPATAQMVK